MKIPQALVAALAGVLAVSSLAACSSSKKKSADKNGDVTLSVVSLKPGSGPITADDIISVLRQK